MRVGVYSESLCAHACDLKFVPHRDKSTCVGKPSLLLIFADKCLEPFRGQLHFSDIVVIWTACIVMIIYLFIADAQRYKKIPY
jgi:hypothetical protein